MLSTNLFDVAISIAVTATGGLPQDKAVQPQPLVEELARCLDLSDDRQRLACTDTAARALVEASRRRDVVVIDQTEVKATRKSLFGFSLPKIGLFGRDGPDKGDEIEKIEAKITSASTLGHGKYAFQIEGGARWATTEAWPPSTEPKAGLIVSIRRGALGSYFVKIGNGKAVRAMRTG